MEKSFSIYCDVLGQGLGCVLMQDGHVVAYTSWQLRKHDVNCPIHDLELAIVVYALKIWRHYLMGKRCELYMDHKSSKYIFMQANMNLRQRRWLELIKDYDMGINYHPRRANVIANALNRRSHANHLIVKSIPSELCDEFAKMKIVANTKVMEMEVGSSLLQEIRRGQVEDEKIQEKSTTSRKKSHPVFWKMMKECCGTKEGSMCLTSRN
jgi:hypothetical protein